MDCTHCAALPDGSTANRFVDELVHDCLYTSLDWVGFILQMISIGAWVVAQVPQFIDNYRNETAEALSPWFLAEWLLGDSSNLAGCLLTGTQLPLTTGTAWYYLSTDVVLIGQYVYYSAKQARRTRREEHAAKSDTILAAAQSADVSWAPAHSSPLLLDEADAAWHVHSLPVTSRVSEASAAEDRRHSDAGASSGENLGQGIGGTVNVCSVVTGLRLGPGMMLACGLTATLLVTMALWTSPERGVTAYVLRGSSKALQDGRLPMCPDPQLPSWARTAGLILGYVSATAYLKSRVSQLVKNCTRGDAEGLAAGMFLCAITGNVTCATGIIVRLHSAQEFMQQLPWLIGTLGTVAMDVVIASQSWAASSRANTVSVTIDTQGDLGGNIGAGCSQNTDAAVPLLQA
eukprot:jgi/Ulvmu1/12027/UM083_0040.1